jgi:hypothetical protein
VLSVILAFSCVLFATGVWWGAPDDWAPDEIRPSDVLDAIQYRFANGWATIYPPLHYAILALCYVPFLIAAALKLTSVTELEPHGDLLMAGRLLSVAMGQA